MKHDRLAGRFLCFRMSFYQVGQIHIQRLREPEQNEIARVRGPAFDPPQMVLVNVGQLGEAFLRETALVP